MSFQSGSIVQSSFNAALSVQTNKQNLPGADFASEMAKAVGAPAASAVKAEAAGKEDAKEEFMKLANMNPAQRMRYLWLKQHKMSEEDLKSMSPTKRQAIEDQIAAEIKRSIEQRVDDRMKRAGLGGTF